MNRIQKTLAAITLLAAWPCFGADLASFSLRIRDSLRVADTELVERQGVAYVSLSSLVNQVGGGCKLSPGRVQVDLAEKTAWMQPNGTQVTASLEDFTLGHPVLREGDDALIALSDVPTLFDRAFLLSIRQDTAPVAPPPAPPVPAPPPEPVPAPAPTPVPEPLPAPPETKPAEPKRAEDRPIQVVVVDPGHGGNDTGCEGAAGLKESALTMAIAQKLRETLEKGGGLKVVLTRDADRDRPRADRAAAAMGGKGDLFLGLHAGAGLAGAATGFEIFCCKEKPAEDTGKQDSPARLGMDYAARSRRVAEAIAKALADATGAVNRGIHAAPCAVVSDVAMCGLLIEVGTLSNPADEALLQTEEHQTKIAEGIAAGVRQYMAAPEGAKP